MGLFSRLKSGGDKSRPQPNHSDMTPSRGQAQEVRAPKPQSKSAVAEQIKKFEQKIEMFEKRSDVIRKQMDDEKAKALKFKSERQEARALNALKRRKELEKKLANNEAMITNYRNQMNLLDDAAAVKTGMEGLEEGVKITAQQQVSAERVEELQDKMQDNYDKQEEINAILQQEIGDVYDKDELFAELEAEEALDAAMAAPELGPSTKVPQAPATAAPSQPKPARTKVEEEEDELAKELQKLGREMEVGM
mmetsp:Transcript_1184/g.3671  ORF Transcript_1184/g.3671 Transcript_1184/m.3671 type:complete len:250 (-) Transcript_1184:138-887(-)